MAEEVDRLAALAPFLATDAPVAAWIPIATLAADLFDAPIGLVTLVDRDRVWLKARIGMDPASLPREGMFCGEIVRRDRPETLAVEDAWLDPRFKDHPAVTGPPGARFYAGAALVSSDGWRLGSVCVMDPRPRQSPGRRQLDQLRLLAGLAVGELERAQSLRDSLESEKRLAAAKRAAERRSAAQSELLANMSHEIRTPLNSIIGFMQVLKRDGALAEGQIGYAGRIEEAGRSLLRLADDVLDLSKTEADTIPLDERPFSPADLARDTAALIRPQASEKGLAFLVEAEPEAAAAVVGDADRLRQVLLNLLSNAVKFTSSGQVSLHLVAKRAASEVVLTFTVEDSGMGIAAEHIPNLFHRFAQADKTIARRFGGTGLGLAISKRLVEAMGGSIAVDSRLGVGSRFTVEVALRLAQPSAGPVAGAAPGKRLLVADDVAINQKLVEAILAPLGCAVDLVSNGIEALQAVQQQDYALVLMDMQMPILDGVEAARAIRRLGGRHTLLPIVALTAHVFPEQAERAREAGMNDIVTKPIEADRLLATVVKWIGDPRPAAHSQPAEPGE